MSGSHLPFLAVLFLSLHCALPAPAQSSINAADKYAYGATTGWINLRPSASDGIVVTETFLAGKAYGANIGWIGFGGGEPADGVSYANDSPDDYGVNHDGAGSLSGFAYGANVGWINFGWASAADPNRPRIDLLSGDFAGFAYSANTGWINLGTGILTTDILVCPDEDEDGMADSWEMRWFGNLTSATLTSDFDGDRVLDRDEYFAATDPQDFASWFKWTAMSGNVGTTQTEVTFTSSPQRLYRLESSIDLSSWIDSGFGAFMADGATTTRVIIHPAGARRFFRAAAIKPLQP